MHACAQTHTHTLSLSYIFSTALHCTDGICCFDKISVPLTVNTNTSMCVKVTKQYHMMAYQKKFAFPQNLKEML